MSFSSRFIDKFFPEATKAKIIKHAMKKQVNSKLGLDGELDEHVDALAGKAIDKIGASNILKAKDMYDKLKDAESKKNK